MSRQQTLVAGRRALAVGRQRAGDREEPGPRIARLVRGEAHERFLRHILRLIRAVQTTADEADQGRVPLLEKTVDAGQKLGPRRDVSAVRPDDLP